MSPWIDSKFSNLLKISFEFLGIIVIPIPNITFLTFLYFSRFPLTISKSDGNDKVNTSPLSLGPVAAAAAAAGLGPVAAAAVAAGLGSAAAGLGPADKFLHLINV